MTAFRQFADDPAYRVPIGIDHQFCCTGNVGTAAPQHIVRNRIGHFMNALSQLLHAGCGNGDQWLAHVDSNSVGVEDRDDRPRRVRKVPIRVRWNSGIIG
ncbi:hypothetical protein D5S18_29840 [Nocardia panacis]|uniref:Uncharacterized protein n=1 Tax=Nocardia panacis TaxID=2340916 RepID=A0A3A4KL97_9NOCA|nr:hypothetical protein D5S18_29840 [Nocardia panacis]